MAFFSTLLTIMFIALKLTGYITWSWFFVLLPTIIFVVLWFLAITVIYIMCGARR
jgi:hypothetical protein